MQEVWKFRIPVGDLAGIAMPRGAKVLYVAAQREIPCLWALVDPSALPDFRRFRLVGTGDPIEENPDLLVYCGSFMMHDGTPVFHLFEIK